MTVAFLEEDGNLLINSLVEGMNYRAPFGSWGCVAGFNGYNVLAREFSTPSANVNMLGRTPDPHINDRSCRTVNYY